MWLNGKLFLSFIWAKQEKEEAAFSSLIFSKLFSDTWTARGKSTEWRTLRLNLGTSYLFSSQYVVIDLSVENIGQFQVWP